MFSQNLEDEKATVYFVRLSKYAAHARYYILDQDSLININEGINWFSYKCNEGEHLFWVTNRKHTDFLTADLIAGKSYMAIIYLYPGHGKTSMQLLPLTKDKKNFDKAKDFILSEDETLCYEEDVFYKMKALNKRGVIKESLDLYENTWKNERNYDTLNDSCIITDEAIMNKSKINKSTSVVN